jgi:hypothetical protein
MQFGPPADHHNTGGQLNPAVHSLDGISSVDFPTPIDSQIIETTEQLKGFPLNLHMNSGYQLGIGIPIEPRISTVLNGTDFYEYFGCGKSNHAFQTVFFPRG